MIIDTSALVAILTGEPDGERLLELAARAPALRISAATALEAAVVLDCRTAPEQRRRLDDLLDALEVEIVPFDAEQFTLARSAYQDFGKGQGHPAQLNLGDCFSYALHRAAGESLLYAGDDFARAGVPQPLGSAEAEGVDEPG